MFSTSSFIRGDFVIVICTAGLGVGLFLIPEPISHYFMMFIPLLSLLAADLIIKLTDALAELMRYEAHKGSAASAYTQKYAGSLSKSNSMLALLLIFLSLPSAIWLRLSFHQDNTQQLNEIAYIVENTRPEETVMIGWKGTGVFRPHAYFYWPLHYGIRAMLTDSDKKELLNGLENGTIAPKLIDFGEDLHSISPSITEFFKTHYEAVGIGDIHVRIKS